MADIAAQLEKRIADLEGKLEIQEKQQQEEISKYESDITDLKRIVHNMEGAGGQGNVAEYFARRAEWTISDFSKKEAELQKGQSMWSPKFKACGLDGLQLEFFPNGREKTTYAGFCSLFLWCPTGTRAKYQLWVGNFLRGPDDDEYPSWIGHGHSNFCPLAPEVDKKTDALRVGVDFLDVKMASEVATSGLRLTSMSLESLVAREIEVVRNRNVDRVVWTIGNVSQQLQQLPRGASMWSQLFTAAGIREILLEFYPNGSANTTKEGHCAFYIRCPEGVSMIVTLFVGGVKKGPIKTVFDSQTGKGLPDFCVIRDQINEDDTLQLGIEVKNDPSKTLLIES